jgi:hypothetical protein
MLACEIAADTHHWKVQRLERRFSKPRRTLVSNQKPHKIMEMQMFGKFRQGEA